MQTASKCYEKYLIDFAKLTIDLDNWKENPKKNPKEGVLSGTQCSIQITQNSETSESYFDVDFGKCCTMLQTNLKSDRKCLKRK